MPEYPIKIFRHSRLSLSTHSCLFLSSYRSILLHALLLFNQLHVLLRLCKEILHQSILFKRQGSSPHDVLNLRSHHRIGQCAAHHHEYTGAQHILKVIYNELPDVVVHLLHKCFAFLCQLPMHVRLAPSSTIRASFRSSSSIFTSRELRLSMNSYSLSFKGVPLAIN